MNRRFDVLPALVVLFAMMFPLRGGFTDDGFIHVQYARNLMTHGEYSFNPGETSFGTTSPLWVMALAVIGQPFGGGEALVDAGKLFSWLFAFAAVIALHRVLLLFGASRRTALFGAMALAADVWLVRWGALGMESSLAAFMVALLVGASRRAYDDRAAAAAFGAVAAIGALVRPELYLAMPVFLAGALTRRPRPAFGVLLTAVVVMVALVGPWLVFAKVHIGSFLPNTAGAKSGGLITSPVVFARGLWVPAKIIASSQVIAVVAIISDLVVSRRDAFVLRPAFRFAALWMLALPLAYVVADIQILSRYLLLVTPAICLAGWMSLESLLRATAPRVRAAVFASALAIAVIANGIVYARVVVPPSREFSEDLQVNMVALARFLHEEAGCVGDEVGVGLGAVAAADIGYLAFYSKCRVLDLGGLVEPEMGKILAKHDYEEIIDKGLYFNVPGYPRVGYVVDRSLVQYRLENRIINGHSFTGIYMTTVRNLGIRKPGTYYYVLYRVGRVVE